MTGNMFGKFYLKERSSFKDLCTKIKSHLQTNCQTDSVMQTSPSPTPTFPNNVEAVTIRIATEKSQCPPWTLRYVPEVPDDGFSSPSYICDPDLLHVWWELLRKTHELGLHPHPCTLTWKKAKNKNKVIHVYKHWNTHSVSTQFKFQSKT